jgi:hypothetical protein
LASPQVSRIRNIELRQTGLDKIHFDRQVDVRVTKPVVADLECGCSADESAGGKRCDGKPVMEDDSVARRLRMEDEEERLAAANEMEQADAALARRLQAEEEQQIRFSDVDRSLAATLQGEYGRAGKILLRAHQLDEFLTSPLGDLPPPRQGDLAPETLRRLVALTATEIAT